MGSVRVAIVGVGNCATSLIQGVEYYKDADPSGTVPGLMHVLFGDYHVKDVEFVAAFDVDDKKVGKDLAEAINSSENNTIKIADVPTLGVEVQRGPTLDGLGKYYRETIEESDAEPVEGGETEPAGQLLAGEIGIEFPAFSLSDHWSFFADRSSQYIARILTAGHDHFSGGEPRQRGLQIIELDGSQPELTRREIGCSYSDRITITAQRA